MSIEELTLETFLKRNNIDLKTWQDANIQWGDLLKIGIACEDRSSELEETAAFMMKRLQKCTALHSVRWRVKNPEHVIEKIIRKRANKEEKYGNV